MTVRHDKLLAVAVMSVLFVSAAGAYTRSTFLYSDGPIAERRVDNAGIQFYVNSGIVPGLQSSASGKSVTVISAGSNPVAAIQAALSSWNGIPGVNLKFLPLKTTDKLNNADDNQMTVVVGSTAADLSAVGGALAITAIQSASFVEGTPDGKGVIADSDIIINPAFAFSTDLSTSTDLQGVMTHEIGHALGLSHSGLLGAVMFQQAGFSARYLTKDEIGFVAGVYPASAVTGTISGKVVASDGSAIQSALVTLLETTTGAGLTALTGSDGTWSLQALPGNFIMYAEPLSAGSLVQPGNLYLLTTTPVSTNFQTTMLGGFTSPTKVAVTAGSTSKFPDLTVTTGKSSLAWPFLGVGGAAVTGDTGSVFGSAVAVSSGQAADLLLIGGGIDGTVSIQAFGRGVTVRPGTVRVDPKVTFGGSLTGQPLVRVTVDVAAVDSPSLVSLIITKGSSVFAVSGGFIAVPPKPAFVTAGVDSAASAQYLGAVSPGGLSSIYGIPGAATLGPAGAVLNAGYDEYGKLSPNLSGVNVTFDGVPAPLVFVSAGQINLQVPLEVAGKTSTKVVVNYLGSLSSAVTVPVVSAQPAFFMISATDPFAANQDYASNPQPNSAGNPAARGSVLSVYGTGVGNPNYTVVTGSPAPGPPAGFTGGYTCALGGKSMSVPFAGWTPTAVGLSQWSFVIPTDAPTGPVSLKCTDTASGASTQTATIYLK